MLRTKKSLRHLSLLCTTAAILSFPTHSLFSMVETSAVSEAKETPHTYLDHQLRTGIIELDMGRAEIASNFDELHCDLHNALIDCAHHDFIVPFLHGIDDEEERISTHQAFQKALIDNLKVGNSFAVVLLFEHAKYLKKTPQDYLTECLDVAGIPASDILRSITLGNPLTIAINGNSPMTQFLWQHDFNATWHQPFNEVPKDQAHAMQEMATKTGNQTAHYMLMRSFFKMNIPNESIISLLNGFKDIGITAAADYLGVIEYNDIIKTLDGLSPEEAIAGPFH